MEDPRGAARENVSQTVQELSGSTQVSLKESISEMEHFLSHHSTAEMASALQEGNKTYAEDKKQGMGNTEVKDCAGTHDLMQETGGLPLMVTSEQLGQNSSINADTWWKYNLQYTNTDNCKCEESNVSLEREADNLQDFKKHGLSTQYINVTKGIEGGGHLKDISESTFNEMETGLLSSTMRSMKFDDLSEDDALCITDHTLPYEHTFSPWKNYNLQYTNTDNRKPEQSNISFESERVKLWDFKKQGSYNEQANESEEIECGRLGMSDNTFNVKGSGPLSIAMKPGDIAQDDTLCITDWIPPGDHTQLRPECKESVPTLKVTDHKNTSNKGNLGKLFKSINEDIAVFKIFLNEADQDKILDQLESKPLQKALSQLHIHAQSFSSENLQCREQINKLKTEKTSLHLQLSLAEQEAEAYRQRAKAMNDKCEELLTQRTQIQDERDNLSSQMQLLRKDLSAADTEKEKLIKTLDSSKKMTLSYAKEKQEIHRKWNEAVIENYHLKKNAEECRTQHLKSNDSYTENKMQGTNNIEEEDCVGKCNILQGTGGLLMMVTSEQLGIPKSMEPSSGCGQNPSVNVDTCKNLQYTNTDNCKPEQSNISYEYHVDNLLDFKKQGSNNEHVNETEEIECGRLGLSDGTFNVNSLLSNTMKHDVAQDDTLCITDLIPPGDYTQFSPGCKESEQTLEETEDNKSTYEMEILDTLFKSMKEEIAWLKGFLSEAERVKISSRFESEPFQKALRCLHIHFETLNSENLQCRELINRLKTEKTSLHIQLSIAEQEAEAYHQHAKVMTDKCEELLTESTQLQDERDHLSNQMKSLMKEIELLREEKQKFLKYLSITNTEKEELIEKLDSAQKMALSYGEEKQEIQCKWNETLMENYNLKKQAEECRSQHETYMPGYWSIRVFYK